MFPTPSSKDPLVYLNYAILLYNHGERRAAAKQFAQFEMRFQQHTHPNPDDEVCIM